MVLQFIHNYLIQYYQIDNGEKWMKLFISLILFVSSLVAFDGGEVGETMHNFKYETNFDVAWKKAKDQNKILMVMVFKKGCPNCSYMKDIVFERENILNYLNENFETVLLDIHKHNYPKRFRSNRAPTFFFIDTKDGDEIIPKHIGGWRDFKFIKILQDVKAKYDGDNNTTK